MSHDVFISYSSADRLVAASVCEDLEREGIRCWIAPRDIPAGKDYAEAIIDAVSGCNVTVLVFSGNANLSTHVIREVERAVSKGKSILTFRIDSSNPSKTLEYLISATQWLDAVAPPLQPHLRRLMEAIRVLMTDVGQRPKLSRVTELRLFMSSLPVVSEAVMREIHVLELMVPPDGHNGARPPNPRPSDELMDKIDELCARESVALPHSWRRDYWDHGRHGHLGAVRAITLAQRRTILEFLNVADDELLFWAVQLCWWPMASFQRSSFLRRFFLRDTEKYEAETILRRLENAGLITQGVPPHDRIGRDTGNLRHETTRLTGRVCDSLRAAGIELTPPQNERANWIEKRSD